MCYLVYGGEITTSRQREFNLLQKGPFTMQINLKCLGSPRIANETVHGVGVFFSAVYSCLDVAVSWIWLKKKACDIYEIGFLFKGLNLRWVEALKPKDESKRYEFYEFQENF